MPNYPLVSVIIPTYNQENFLKRAVESALSQDYENIEIIISDDHSSDSTFSVANTFAFNERVVVCRNATNMGRVRNYHHALYDLCHGEWVVNLDGDDFFTDNHFISEAVARIVQAGKMGKQVGFYMASQRKILKGSTIALRNKVNGTRLIDSHEFFSGLFTQYFMSHLATIYNRPMALTLDFYTDDLISSDMVSLLRLALACDGVILSDKVVGQWNYTGQNESFSLNIEDCKNDLSWIPALDDKLRNQLFYRERVFFEVRSYAIYLIPILKCFLHDPKLILKVKNWSFFTKSKQKPLIILGFLKMICYDWIDRKFL